MIPVQIIAEIVKRAPHTAAAAAPAVAGGLTKGAALERREFRDLIRRSKQNRLGLSQAQQNQMVGETTGDMLAQQRAANASAARTVAASGMNTGQATQTLAKAQQAQMGAAQAAARGQAQQLSTQVAQIEKERLRALAEQRRKRTEQTTEAISQALVGNDGKKGESGGGTGGLDFSNLSGMFGGKASGATKTFAK